MSFAGIYLINKPKGITSHDVVDRLRRITGERTIGHAGTLDPNACGLMIVAIDRAYTQYIGRFVGLDKEYIAEVTLGAKSSTYDAMGELTPVSDTEPTLEDVRQALIALTGTYEQMPPIYSAKKIGGQKAYDLARKGQAVPLAPKLITVHALGLVEYKYPQATLTASVSSGTYIRTIAHELGEKLGTGGYLSGLIRSKIGEYSLEKTVTLEDFTERYESARIEIPSPLQ